MDNNPAYAPHTIDPHTRASYNGDMAKDGLEINNDVQQRRHSAPAIMPDRQNQQREGARPDTPDSEEDVIEFLPHPGTVVTEVSPLFTGPNKYLGG